MRGDIDPLDFVLAETLGKSLAEIRDLDNAEFIEWRAFRKVRDALTELHSRPRAGRR